MSTKTPQSGTRFSQKPLKKRPSATPKKIRVKYKEELTKKMAHMVFCTKYKAEMEGLDEPPFDSDFGQKIYKNVSKKPGASGSSARRCF